MAKLFTVAFLAAALYFLSSSGVKMGAFSNGSVIVTAKVSNHSLWEFYVSDFIVQWEREPVMNYIFAVLMMGLGVFGTIANLIVIVSFLIVKDLHQLQYAFVGNLAAADLIITSVVIPVNVVATIRGPQMFRDHPWFCELDGTICASACAGSIWCIMAISVERYICICYYPLYQKIFTPFGVTVIIIITWIIAHSIHLPNYLGWGVTSYSADLYLCTAELHVWSYSVFYGASAILMPIGVSFFAYFQIYLRVRVSRAARKVIVPGSRQRPEPTITGDVQSDKTVVAQTAKTEALKQEIQILKALFKVFLMFLVSWLPLGLFFVARSWLPFPKWYSYAGLIVAHGSSATNSVIYFWMTGLVRMTYAGFQKLCCRHRRTRAFMSEEYRSQSQQVPRPKAKRSSTR